jgi:uncharacterized protein YndB with AHSA1/START domain
MPTNKDFKRVVRDRMKKTGESYTAARSQLLRSKQASKRTSQSARVLSAASPVDYAKRAGMSDASVKKATGCNWETWVKALDYAKAESWTHRQIADYVHSKFKVADWWTQTVTVGYERIKGLRARGQRRDGTYEVSKSKVIPVPLDRLFDAFNDSRRRARWLTGVQAEVRHVSPNKSIRMRWPDESAVDVGFFSKGAAKSQVAIGHRKLASQSDAAKMKTFWSEKLQALAELLTAGAATRP